MIDWAALNRRMDVLWEWSDRHPWLTLLLVAAFAVWGIPAIVPFLH